MKDFIVELHFAGNLILTRLTSAETEAMAISNVMETRLFYGFNGFYYPRHSIVKARAYEEKSEDESGKKGRDLASAC
jgi:hypothetical protein